MWKDFKAFIMRGNVIDLAVAVVIGGAFGAIVTSFVQDIIMPPIGLNFTELSLKLKDAVLGADGAVVTKAVTLNYGLFIQTVIDFLIVAFCIFLMVKAVNKLKREPPAKPAAK